MTGSLTNFINGSIFSMNFCVGLYSTKAALFAYLLGVFPGLGVLFPLPSFSFLGVLSPFLGVLSPFMGVEAASPFLSGLAGVPFASFFGVF